MQYICIVPNYWGKGDTIAEAKARCKEAGGNLKRKRAIYEVEDDDAYCEQINGDIMHKKGTLIKPVELKGYVLTR